MRLNINIDDDLIQRVDDFAKENFINRTSAICILLSNALRSNDIQSSIIKMGQMQDMLNELQLDELQKENSSILEDSFESEE